MADIKAVLFEDGKFQAVGNNGQVVPYGKLYFFDAISGAAVDTYTTSTMQTKNTHPIILSSSGKADVYVTDGQFNVNLRDKNDVTVWTINDFIPAGGTIPIAPTYTSLTREDATGIVGSSWTLDETPVTTITVHKNGLLLNEDEYSLDGKTITFVDLLIITDELVAEYGSITLGGNTELVYSVDTMTDLLSVSITDILAVNIEGYSASNDGGGGPLNYDATVDKATANAGTIIDPGVSLALQGTGVGLGCWVRQHDGSINILACGSTGAADENITSFISAALAVGITNIYVNQKSIAVTGTVDLDGASITGQHTKLISGGIGNGRVIDIERSPSVLRSPESSNIATSKHNTKIMYRQALTDDGQTNPNGEVYSIISPSSCGGIARFTVANGLGGAGASDLGAPFDRLRPLTSYIYVEGYTLYQTTDVQSAGVADLGADLSTSIYGGRLTDFQYSSDGSSSVQAKQIPYLDYVEYLVYGAEAEGNVIFRTSSSAPTDWIITVNGVVQVTGFSAVGGVVAARLAKLSLDVGVINRVRVTNNSSGITGQCWGMNFYNLAKLPSMERGTEQFFDKVVCFGGGAATANIIGAGYDSVIVDENGKFGGSYHGGDVSTNTNISLAGASTFDIVTSTNPTATNPMTANMYCSDHISIRYAGSIQAAQTIPVWMKFDFSVDGGVQVRGTYTATSPGVVINQMFTGMCNTDRALINTPINAFIEGTPTETNTEYPKSMTPFVQYSNDGRHIAITPKFYSNDQAPTAQFIWDTASYLKYYYTPISGHDTTIDLGEGLSFDCLYQLGNSII